MCFILLIDAATELSATERFWKEWKQTVPMVFLSANSLG